MTVQLLESEIRNRSIYLKDRSVFCRAGGFHSWIRAGRIPSDLHPNYGLPCVAGTITFEDGTETVSGCIHCGRRQ